MKKRFYMITQSLQNFTFKRADYLINELKEYSVSEIKELMNLSDNLFI